ncbi:N-acetyltransferase [Cryobacterium algoritolerans]|uniref:N-acetyltransferase n=1 Tax=Cryobacterium algoritolerans TaxID=1259184 RepID=A0A4R8WWV5_9MICO|nr:GNAT family N-acetyltransferase [Cryobacterium algoritolerans]TFC19788.1 N-acetyltransferase [Cryobacterium algoritolerans]
MPLALRTDRLLLRRWREADREPFSAMGADPAVMRYFPGLLTRAEGDALAARADALFDEYGYGLWALEHASSGAFLGFTGLAPMPDGIPGAGGVEVGWRLAGEFWGRGYATEAARATLGFALGELALSEVNSITAVINVPSRAVMDRLGMTLVDEFEHPRVALGSPLRAHVRYRIRRD